MTILIEGKYPFPLNVPVVPASDGSGEILETGSKVSQFKKGDKVVTLFNQAHQYGPVDFNAANSGLGGVIDGTLRQYGVFNENGVVRTPTNLPQVLIIECGLPVSRLFPCHSFHLRWVGPINKDLMHRLPMSVLFSGAKHDRNSLRISFRPSGPHILGPSAGYPRRYFSSTSLCLS
jgi:hypothetical protein